MRNLKFTLKAWPVIALATIGLCFLTSLVAQLFGVTLNEQASLEVVKQYAGWNRQFAKILFMVLVFAPVGEELLFRGLLWKLPSSVGGWLMKKLHVPRLFANHLPPVLAVLSSAAFSAAHYVEAPWPENAFFALFFFGLAQCWLYRHTRAWYGIWSPILKHFLFNLTNLILLFTIPESWMK